MGVTKLKIDYDYDFLLVGIITSNVDYKLAWYLNNTLDLALGKEENYELQLQGKIDVGAFPELNNSSELPSFSFYNFYHEDNQINYTLVGNKSNAINLVAEEQSVDFFLIIDGVYYDLDLNEIIEKIRSINNIVTAYEINVDNLKSKHNLIFE